MDLNAIDCYRVIFRIASVLVVCGSVYWAWVLDKKFRQKHPDKHSYWWGYYAGLICFIGTLYSSLVHLVMQTMDNLESHLAVTPGLVYGHLIFIMGSILILSASWLTMLRNRWALLILHALILPIMFWSETGDLIHVDSFWIYLLVFWGLGAIYVGKRWKEMKHGSAKHWTD